MRWLDRALFVVMLIACARSAPAPEQPAPGPRPTELAPLVDGKGPITQPRAAKAIEALRAAADL